MTVPSGAASAATPSNLLDPIVTLMSALPLGSWPWVAVAIGAITLFAYAAHRLTPDTVEDLGSRQARQLTEGGQR